MCICIKKDMEVNAVSCVLHHHSHSHTHTMAGRGGHHLENLWSHNILQKLVNSNANNTLNGLKSSIMIVITDVVTTLLQPYWSTFLVQAPLCPAGYSHLSLRSLHTRVDEFQSRTGSISPVGHISKQAFYSIKAGDEQARRLSSISCSHRVGMLLQHLSAPQGSFTFLIWSQADIVAKGHQEGMWTR